MKVVTLFEVVSGDFHAIKELDSGNVPLVSCGDTDNGVMDYFDIPKDKQYQDTITVAYNGSASGSDCQGHVQAYSYDCSGNLTGDGIWAYTYDPENHMMSANKTGTSATYAYDLLGRRQTKTVGVLVTNMLSDGDDLIAEYDGSGSGTVLRRFVPGPAINDPIAYENCAGATAPNCTGAGVVTEFYHSDHHGSVVTMSAANGDPDTAEGPNKYDPFGRATLAASNQPFRYVGMYYDAETGLYQDRARCYIPNLGRFCQTDPIGYKDDNNLYTYVGNDPTDKTDPSGWSGCADMKEQGLSGQCFDSQNFRPQGNEQDKSNAFKQDAVGTPATDSASAAHASTNRVTSGNEGVNRVDISTDAKGNQTSSFTPVPVENATPTGATVKNMNDLSGGAAAEHPHIPGNPCCGRFPGPGDWKIPSKTGKANYVEQGGGSTVVEISGGQARIRVISGPNLSRTNGDYQDTQRMVDQYQTNGGQ